MEGLEVAVTRPRQVRHLKCCNEIRKNEGKQLTGQERA